MKKKLSLFLISIFLIPLFALFGCEEVSSYPILVFSSYSDYGSVNGSGTYDDGSTVTLTATAKQGSSFIAWVFQNSTQLEDNDTYKIETTQDSSQKNIKSTLTFTMNSSLQGRYTAVFEDSKMIYVKLDSYRLTTTPESEGLETGEDAVQIATANINISQGLTDLVTVYQGEELTVKDNVITHPEKVNKVLKLSTETAQHVYVSAQFNFKLQNETTQSMSKNLRADLFFQNNSEKIETSTYSYTTTYNESTKKYTIDFEFDFTDKTTGTTTTYHFIVVYKNLSNA